MANSMIGSKRKMRTDSDEEECYKKSFVQDNSEEEATSLSDVIQPVSGVGVYSMRPVTIAAVSVKDAVYIVCPCCKRRLYRGTNGDLACEFHGEQEVPTYDYRVRVKLLEGETGAVLWVSLFDEVVTQFIRINANEFTGLTEDEKKDALKEILGTSVQFTIKKCKRGAYVNYDVMHAY